MLSSSNVSRPNNNRPPSSAEGASLSSERITPPRAGGGQQQQQDLADDASEVARAAAEVSVMPNVGPPTGIGGEAGGGGGRDRQPGQEAANAAIQGTAGEGGEATAFEVVDEGGELVKVRFNEFLNS